MMKQALMALFLLFPVCASAQVVDVRKVEAFERSIVLHWQTASLINNEPVKHYTVAWWDTMSHTFLGVRAVLPTSGRSGCEIQPLEMGHEYDFIITPYTKSGAKMAYQTSAIPKGTFEAGMRSHVSAGGYLVDLALEPSMMAVNPVYLPTFTNGNRFLPETYPGDFYYSGAAVNNQSHWHQILSDGHAPGAVAAISTRFPQPLDLTIGRYPYTIYVRNDIGTLGRATPYLILSTAKKDLVAIKPVESDHLPLDPNGYEIRWQGFGSEIDIRTFIRGVQIDRKRVSRGYSWHNVQQVMGFRIHKDKIEVLCDRDWDSDPEVVHTVYTDTTQWKNPASEAKLWGYASIGSYNFRKTNNQFGHRPNGAQIHQYAYALWHLGMVAHNGTFDLLTNGLSDPMHAAVSPLDMMPAHTYMKEWSVPTVKVVYPHPKQANRYPDVFSAKIVADNRLSPMITGDLVLLASLKMKRCDTNDHLTQIFSQSLAPVNPLRLPLHDMSMTSMAGEATAEATVTVDTRSWAEGYYQLLGTAYTVVGSSGYNTNEQIYFVDDTDWILIWRRPVNGKAPELSATATTPFGTVELSPGTALPVSVSKILELHVDCTSKSWLTEARFEIKGSDQKWKSWAKWHPARAVYTNAGGGNFRSEWVWRDYIYSWYPRYSVDGKDVLDVRFRFIDADGVETTYPVRLLYQ